jgi:hypothetical protein
VSGLWTLLSGLCLAVCALALLSARLPFGSQRWIVIATLSPYLELLAIPALLISVAEWDWYLIAACVIVGLLSVAQRWPVRRHAERVEDGPVLRVLTANVLYRSDTPGELTA